MDALSKTYDRTLYRNLVRQLLPKIRKPMSQGQLALRLRVAATRIGDWESGRKSVSWRDFARICEAARLPLQEAFRKFSALPPELPASDAKKIFRKYAGQGTQAEISARLGLARDRVGRLLRGEATPTTAEILRAFHCTGPAFYGFLDFLARGQDLADVADRMQRHRAQNALYAESPWTSLISTVLDLPEYRNSRKHSDAWLASRTRLARDTVRESLRRMVEAKLVEFDGKLYRLLPLESFTPSGDTAGIKRGIRYWNALAASAAEEGYGKPGGRFSWSVFNLSDPAREELQAAFHLFRRTMSGIIDADERRTEEGKRTYVYSLTLADVAYVPEGASGSGALFGTTD